MVEGTRGVATSEPRLRPVIRAAARALRLRVDALVSGEVEVMGSLRGRLAIFFAGMSGVLSFVFRLKFLSDRTALSNLKGPW